MRTWFVIKFKEGVTDNIGAGEALGRKLNSLSPKFGNKSLLLSAYRKKIPITIHVAIGTDSYSSNWQLNVTKEMQSLLKHTSLSEEQVLTMATINGAKALQWENELGSFEKGKQPGVIVIENDFSASKRIL